MSNPLVYILAPFALAFGLFAIYLVVSIILRDPARPFRMFAASPPDDGIQEARDILQCLEGHNLDEKETEELLGRLEELAGQSHQSSFWTAALARAASIRDRTGREHN